MRVPAMILVSSLLAFPECQAKAQENPARLFIELPESYDLAPDEIRLPEEWLETIKQGARIGETSGTEESGCLYVGDAASFDRRHLSDDDKGYRSMRDTAISAANSMREENHDENTEFYTSAAFNIHNYDESRRAELLATDGAYGVVSEDNAKSEFTTSFECHVNFGYLGNFHTHPVPDEDASFSPYDIGTALTDFLQGNTFTVVVNQSPTYGMMLALKTREWDTLNYTASASVSTLEEMTNLRDSMKLVMFAKYWRPDSTLENIEDSMGDYTTSGGDAFMDWMWADTQLNSSGIVLYRGKDGVLNKVGTEAPPNYFSDIWNTAEFPPQLDVALDWVGLLSTTFDQGYTTVQENRDELLDLARRSENSGKSVMPSKDDLILGLLETAFYPDWRDTGTGSRIWCLELTPVGNPEGGNNFGMILTPECIVGTLGKLTPKWVPGSVVVSFSSGEPDFLRFYQGEDCKEEYAIVNNYRLEARTSRCNTSPWKKTKSK